MARYPLFGPWERFHPDMPFFEALGTSAVKFGPGVDPFMSGDDIRYHWFAYLWSGQLTVALDLAPFAALTRVVPVAVVAGLAALAAGTIGRLGKRWWGPVLAVALVITGGFAGAAYGVITNVDSPSTAITALWLMGFTAIAFSSGLGSRLSFAVSLMSGFLLSGAKVSALAVLILAWVVMAALGRIWRAEWTRAVLIQLMGLIVGATISFFLFDFGSSSSGDLRLLSWDSRASSVQGLDLGPSWWAVALGTLLLCIAIVPRAAGIVGLPTRSTEAALAVGLVVASILPIWVLSQGVNELWFAVAAAAPLAVLSVVGLERLWDQVKAGSVGVIWGLVAVAAGVLSAVAAAVLWPLGASDVVTLRSIGPLVPWLVGFVIAGVAWPRSGKAVGIAALATSLLVAASLGRGITVFGEVGLQSSTGRNASIPDASSEANSHKIEKSIPERASSSGKQPPSTPQRVGSVQWSSAQDEAALWLRRAASSSDVLATDQTGSSMIPAVSANVTFLSALTYQEMYGSKGQASIVDERRAYSLSLATGLTPETLAVLCAARVSWLWMGTAAAPLELPVAFANSEVTIYALDSTACET